MRIVFSIWVIILWCSMVLDAQKYDYNWVIGTLSFEGDTADRFGGILISFEDSFSVRSRPDEESNLEMYVTTTTMSSYEGDLAFYTNGCEVHGAHGQLIIDGDTMVESASVNNSFCYPIQDRPRAGSPITFGLLAFPDPESENRYYIIFCDDAFRSDIDFYSPKLHGWHVEVDPIDPSLSRVIDKRILLDSLEHSAVTYSATKGMETDHWWLILAEDGDVANGYLLIDFYNLDSFSTHTQYIGQRGLNTCRALFSPDGKRYAALSCDDRLSVFDFDRTTGTLSGERQYNGQLRPDGISILAFSYSAELLYLWDTWHMYQLDLVAPAGGDTLVLIDTFDGFQDPFPTGFGRPQLGPDCRLYITSSGGSSSMHVIDYPDRRGQACSFRQHVIRLPHSNPSGIPHHPNYRLDDGPSCDSNLFVTVTAIGPPRTVGIASTLYPNPAYDEVQVELASDIFLPEWYEIYDSQGRVVDRRPWPDWQVSHRIDVRGMQGGLYFVRLVDMDADGFGQTTLKMVVGD